MTATSFLGTLANENHRLIAQDGFSRFECKCGEQFNSWSEYSNHLQDPNAFGQELPQTMKPAPSGGDTNPNSISTEYLLQMRRELFAKLDQVLLDKGNDYNAAQQESGDTLFNLRIASIMGIVPSPEMGILVRLGDKFMRLASLLNPGVQQKVKDESIEDTIGDAINYLTYIAAFRRKRAGR